jgi:hypothetical protein
MSEVAPQLGRLFRILLQVLGRTSLGVQSECAPFFCPHIPLRNASVISSQTRINICKQKGYCMKSDINYLEDDVKKGAITLNPKSDNF